MAEPPLDAPSADGSPDPRATSVDRADTAHGEPERDAQAPRHDGNVLTRHGPFSFGFMATLGAVVAYVLFRTIADLGSLLQLIGLALFIAVGLNPAVTWLERRRIPRWAAVVIVIVVLLGVIGVFTAAAVGPIGREVHQLQVSIPKWRADLESGRGWIGHLAKELHLQNQLKSGAIAKHLSTSAVAHGVLGAGRLVVSVLSATIITCVLAIYFLVALPAVRSLWLRSWPESRRLRVAALTDEVLSRTGGFVLGNLLTSVIAGVGTWIWAAAFGIPYPFLLALLVALLDLIPLIGSTIAGVVVALVALLVSLPVAIATMAFYIVYRFLEDYLLTPKVMRHAVRISPGLTIVAGLVGGALLGLIGALVAIPLAAAIQLVLEEVTFRSLDRR